MRSGPAVSAATLLAGVVAGRPSGAIHCGTVRGTGPIEDLRPLRATRWTGKSGIPSLDDGAGAAVRLLHGNDEFAPDGRSQITVTAF